MEFIGASDMTILSTIDDAMKDARNGKLSPYWQNDLFRECHSQKLSDEEPQTLSELNCILSETPQQKLLLTSCKCSTTRSTSPDKKRPAGMRSLHWKKCRSKGLGALPQQTFCSAK